MPIAPPQTIETAVASPNALPIPSIVAAIIPLFAPLRISLTFVCVVVAPSDKEAHTRFSFTAFIEVTASIVIVGTIIIISTVTTEISDTPPAVCKLNT